MIKQMKPEYIKNREADKNNNREHPCPIPLAPPLGFIRQPSITEQIRDMVRSETLKNAAELSGHGSFEDEDDFDVGDDYDPRSPYENEFDPSISELTEAGTAAQTEREEAGPSQKAGPAPAPDPEPQKAPQPSPEATPPATPPELDKTEK